jgi:hypothetical protein
MSVIDQKYQSMLSGETYMRYAGGAAASSTHRTHSGALSQGGPADVKKTFLYNQKLTTGIFQILEDHPSKAQDAQIIAQKVE